MAKYSTLVFILFLGLMGLITTCTTITALKMQEGGMVVFDELYLSLLSVQEDILQLVVENQSSLEKTIHILPLPVVIGTRQVISQAQTGTKQVVVCTGNLCRLETVPVYQDVVNSRPINNYFLQNSLWHDQNKAFALEC